MNMADGVLLVVDSVEGPKPQTRFVLDKGTVRIGIHVYFLDNNVLIIDLFIRNY